MNCLEVLVAAVFCVGSLDVVLAQASTAVPPKIILFQLGDDYGFNNVGFAHGPNMEGNPEAYTPTMNKLAVEEGVRLDRHYVYKYCSPTRSSFLSGRLPLHVNQNNNCNDASSPSGIDLRMTILPQKLKALGWATAMVGKWHCGARSEANLPTSRGFDYHLGFLKGGEDHWEQNRCAGGPDHDTVDLWGDWDPAWGQNGTYSAYLYTRAAVQVVKNFSSSLKSANPPKGLFLYLPWHNTHTPLEAPQSYFRPPHEGWSNFEPRLTYNAMAAALDDGMGNVTNTIKDAGLWDSTIVVFSPDNGGWLLPNGVAGSTNFPLRGGKVTDFEGGVRVASFISGGYLPSSLYGSVHSGYIHVADWYATFCFLAGCDPDDDIPHTGVPPSDSINVWSSILVANTSASPRTMIPLSYCPNNTFGCHVNDSGLIVGNYKIICGDQDNFGYHQWPGFPNGTTPSDPGCPDCCLFDIINDPTETIDLRLSQPEVFANMSAELEAVAKTIYQTNYSDPEATECITDAQAKHLYKGFIGPMCFKSNPIPPTPPPQPFALRKGDDCLMTSDSSAVSKPCSSTTENRIWTSDPNTGWLTTTDGFLKVDEHPTPNVTTKAGFCTRGIVYINPDPGHGATAQGFLLISANGTIQSTYCDGYGCLEVPLNGTPAHTSHCILSSGGWKQDFGY